MEQSNDPNDSLNGSFNHAPYSGKIYFTGDYCSTLIFQLLLLSQQFFLSNPNNSVSVSKLFSQFLLRRSSQIFMLLQCLSALQKNVNIILLRSPLLHLQISVFSKQTVKCTIELKISQITVVTISITQCIKCALVILNQYTDMIGHSLVMTTRISSDVHDI